MPRQCFLELWVAIVPLPGESQHYWQGESSHREELEREGREREGREREGERERERGEGRGGEGKGDLHGAININSQDFPTNEGNMSADKYEQDQMNTSISFV